MHVVVFKDRCARVIRIVFDDARAVAVAYRDDEAVGELSVDDSARAPLLVRLYVEPAYRRSGIAHTLLAHVSRVLGEPIRIDARTRATTDSPEWATLCRCLAHEGLVVVE
ncbi:GNAT family N-acetyltransferase [Burkholderia multivorans]|uniref:GNAT family N-acetyltransferase n=1 Tax=Burkholderia multivorans TaxID=87883 RepID=UPI0020A0083A|nr:GNAT family N-acetyltransferase [Burkholderia multivorans]MCO8590863.1 GNAT family N-acetyltransferase [Burkholderia multivorans]MCO8635508.1 GNAT family N-acetyltransferase [Burkholderia multivorans]MCO8647296.1 GNAT family N-acetyltransferase [Burkholderia multivorans]